MISKILIPTDFSEVANNALQYAIQLAKKTNAEIHVLYVKNIPIMDNSFPNNVYQSYITEVEDFTKKSFDDLTVKFLKNSEVKFETHTAFGFIKDEIKDFADKNKIDLIVLGTTGASGLQEILIGSNAASVAASSEIPVLIIPPTSHFEEIIHLVYATDYNEPEFPAVSRLAYFASLYDADVSVLHIESDYDDLFDSEHNYFNRNKDADEFKKWKIIKLPKGESIIESINNFIANNHSNMIVMAKHNRNFFDRLFHRSLSKKMAYHTKIPLLVLNK
ncbi:MAG: universal stress protein [Bacteroidia bacterium]|nr:universal stress protein [Bacteroidia bacterium]